MPEESIFLVMNIIAGVIIGGISGIIPLLTAIYHKKTCIGILGLIVCIPFGVIAVAFLGTMFLAPIFAGVIAIAIFLFLKKK